MLGGTVAPDLKSKHEITKETVNCPITVLRNIGFGVVIPGYTLPEY